MWLGDSMQRISEGMKVDVRQDLLLSLLFDVLKATRTEMPYFYCFTSKRHPFPLYSFHLRATLNVENISPRHDFLACCAPPIVPPLDLSNRDISFPPHSREMPSTSTTVLVYDCRIFGASVAMYLHSLGSLRHVTTTLLCSLLEPQPRQTSPDRTVPLVRSRTRTGRTIP